MKKKLFLLTVIAWLSSYGTSVLAEVHDWPAYGRGAGGGNFSLASEITPSNVKNLEEAWVHRSGDYHQGNHWTKDKSINSSLQTSFQATPIVVDGTLFYCSPYNKVIALDPETGDEKCGSAKSRGKAEDLIIENHGSNGGRSDHCLVQLAGGEP